MMIAARTQRDFLEMKFERSGSLFAFGLACALVGAFATAVLGYHFTQGVNGKWWTLGRKTGEIHGKADVMQALCQFSEAGKPPTRVDYFLDVKASRLSIVKQDNGVKIFCE